MTDSQDFEYDVALSFAGEQRDYVEAVAARLRDAGVRVFYDAYEKVELWGKDLYEHLDYVYQRAARFCVIFASDDYSRKMWTTHERKSAQARAIEANAEYILPARFDDTEIPGVRETVGHLSLADLSPEDLAALIVEKLGPRRRVRFFPPNPVRLRELADIDEDHEWEWLVDTAHQFFLALTRTSEEERLMLHEIFAQGCPSALPENIHISLDLLRRSTDMPPAEIQELLRGLSSLGFTSRVYSDGDHESDDMIAVTWDDRTVYSDGDQEIFASEWSTQIANAVMRGASSDFCIGCARAAVADLDFSTLAEPAA